MLPDVPDVTCSDLNDDILSNDSLIRPRLTYLSIAKTHKLI